LKAFVYLKINCCLELPLIGLRLTQEVKPESFEHDSENVYEWMWVNVTNLPFALNVSRKHGWADIDGDIESTTSTEATKALVKPGPVYFSGWNRSTDSYINELPDWLPQLVADRLDTDVFVYNGRINVEIPDGEPAAIIRPHQ
jgi:hypothetical protein